MIEIRNVRPGDFISEIGLKCFGIKNDKAALLGTLCKIENLLFIKSNSRHYSPRKFDIVVGKIQFVNPDYYKVIIPISNFNLKNDNFKNDNFIKQHIVGILPVISFPNASKKNKPELKKNDLILTQILKVAPNNLNSEDFSKDVFLTCNSLSLGKIEEAHPLDSNLIRNYLLSDFIKKIPHNFKIALAMNGYFYLSGETEVQREVIKALS